LEKVSKPTRYTGREHGVRIKDWAAVDAKVCLAFPDVYDIGMSHLGYRMLYKILNDDARVLAERCYTPWMDMIHELRAHGEWLRSLESGRPLCDFDVVGFSLQYELTFTNILMMLQLGGIPLRAENRGDDDPLVIAGGPVATHAEPMAMFFDAIAIGDGEELAKEVALKWVETKGQGLTRRQRLERLLPLQGLYIPSFYITSIDPESGLDVVTGVTHPEARLPLERRLLADINQFPFPDDGPVGGPEAIFDRMSIEVARGCTEGCRFCQAGMIYRPVRERNPEEVIATVERALAKSGQDEVSLTALSTADVSCISPLIKRIVEKTAPERISMSVASLRAYGLADDLLDDMRRVRVSGLTFAPEAGTQRMRDVVNKNVTEAQLMDTAERVFSRNFDKMKLYFMIGLPTETAEDVVGIVQVGKNALAVGKRIRGGRAKVTVSVSTHVPKPHTPFQWAAMDSLDTINEKQKLLRAEARGAKNLTLRTHDSKTSVIEGVLARGDRRLGFVIERAFLNGAVFDSWEEHFRLDLWQEALAHFGIDTSLFLGTLPVTGRLPWDHFDIGLEAGFLLREYRKALSNRLSPPCGKVRGMFIHHTNVKEASQDQRKLVCYDCGVACDLTEMRTQRIGFLAGLGATEPGQRAHLPIVSDVPRSLNRPAPELLRPVREGTSQRWRMRFQKTGAAALLGHLDLLRELPRVIRRAGLRIQYSQGFNPKPEISFGPALSLGVSSFDEYMDVQLLGVSSDETDLVERLNAVAGMGLCFLQARPLSPQEPRVNALITGARYWLGIPRSVLDGHGGEERLRERVAALMSQSEHSVVRRVKGIGRNVDVRAGLKSLCVESHDDVSARVGLAGRFVGVVAELAISSQGAIKSSEVVEAIFGEPEVPYRAVRLALLRDGGTPFDEVIVSKRSLATESADQIVTSAP
jgi:radical SAM family uncharacterized protein/radical SAM-linked protein